MKKLIAVFNIIARFFLNIKPLYFKELDSSYISINGYLAAYTKLAPIKYPTIQDIVADLKRVYGEIKCVSLDKMRDFYNTPNIICKKRSPNIFFVFLNGRYYVYKVSFSKIEVDRKITWFIKEESCPLERIEKQVWNKLLGPNTAVYIPVKHVYA